MNVTPENPSAVTIRPPQLIQSLLSGFNTVATNIYLILLPVALDLLLWFGPHLRIKTLMEPSLADLMQFMRQTGSPDMLPVLDSAEALWKQFLNQYNLLSSMSTFPVGLPSIMASRLPIHTPLGAPVIAEISSGGQLILAWLVLSLVGILLGSLYFASIARASGLYLKRLALQADCPPELQPSLEVSAETRNAQVPQIRVGAIGWAAVQSLALVLMLLAILVVLMIPAIVLASFLSLLSAALAQFVLLLVGFGAIWFMIPLIFSPHGIFLCGQSVIRAMLNSMRVVRSLLPGTGLLLLVALVIHQGLGALWATPADSSWMALVGILGSAFISTGLIAASFIYYRVGLTYIYSLRRGVRY